MTFYQLLLLIIINIPKFNLITLGSFDQGIRFEDLMVSFFALKVIFNRNLYKFFPKRIFLIWIYIGFSTLLAITLFEGNNPLRIVYFFRVTEYLLFAIAIYSLRFEINLLLLLKGTIFIQAIFIIIEMLQGSLRPSGTFAGPWELTTVIGLLCFACAAIYPFNGIRKYSYISILVMANFFTLSRTGLISAIFAFSSTYRYFFISTGIFLLIGYLIIAYADLPWLQVVFRPGNIDLVSALVEGALNGNRPEILGSLHNADFSQNASPSLAVRFNIWLNLIHLWGSNEFLPFKLLFGIGLGSISVIVDGFYIRLFFELGIVGTLIYLYLMIDMFRKRELRPLVVYLAIICLTLDPYSSSKIAYTLGIIFACLHNSKIQAHNNFSLQNK